MDGSVWTRALAVVGAVGSIAALTAMASPSGVAPAAGTPQKIVWSCQVEGLGSVPVMVDFAGRKALSARGAALAEAKFDGTRVRWDEKDPESGNAAFQLDSKTGDLQITQTPAKGKAVVKKGKCGPPNKNAGPQASPHAGAAMPGAGMPPHGAMPPGHPPAAPKKN